MTAEVATLNVNPIPYGQDYVERHAATLVEVQRMHDDLKDARAELQKTQQALARNEDRVIILVEERDRYRHESIRFRSLLIELATQMSNISLLAVKAHDVIETIDEIDVSPAPKKELIDAIASQLTGKKK